jgi:hypothetical protein
MSSALFPCHVVGLVPSSACANYKKNYKKNYRRNTNIPTNIPTIRCSTCGHQPSNKSFVPISWNHSSWNHSSWNHSSLNHSSLNSKFVSAAQLLPIPNAWIHEQHLLHRSNRRPERMLLQAHHFADVRAHLRRQFSSHAFSDYSTQNYSTHNSTMLADIKASIHIQFPTKFLTRNASKSLSPEILHDTETLVLILSMTAVLCHYYHYILLFQSMLAVQTNEIFAKNL